MRKLAAIILATGLALASGPTAVRPAFAQQAAPAYLVAEVQVTDAAAYAEYTKGFLPLLPTYGAKIVVAGGPTDTFEGAAVAGRLVIITFPSMDKAREFWNSVEYRALVPLRQKSSTARIYIVEGVAPKS